MLASCGGDRSVVLLPKLAVALAQPPAERVREAVSAWARLNLHRHEIQVTVGMEANGASAADHLRAPAPPTGLQT